MIPSSLQSSDTAVRHRGLGEPHLGLRQRELPATLASARPRGLEPGQGAFADQLPLELGQGREGAEHETAGGGGGVDLRALAGEHPQAHAAGGQVMPMAARVVPVPRMVQISGVMRSISPESAGQFDVKLLDVELANGVEQFGCGGALQRGRKVVPPTPRLPKLACSSRRVSDGRPPPVGP